MELRGGMYLHCTVKQPLRIIDLAFVSKGVEEGEEEGKKRMSVGWKVNQGINMVVGDVVMAITSMIWVFHSIILSIDNRFLKTLPSEINFNNFAIGNSRLLALNSNRVVRYESKRVNISVVFGDYFTNSCFRASACFSVSLSVCLGDIEPASCPPTTITLYRAWVSDSPTDAATTAELSKSYSRLWRRVNSRSEEYYIQCNPPPPPPTPLPFVQLIIRWGLYLVQSVSGDLHLRRVAQRVMSILPQPQYYNNNDDDAWCESSDDATDERTRSHTTNAQSTTRRRDLYCMGLPLYNILFCLFGCCSGCWCWPVDYSTGLSVSGRVVVVGWRIRKDAHILFIEM